MNNYDFIRFALNTEIIPEVKLHKLSVIFGEKAVSNEQKAGRDIHPDSLKAIEMKKKWMAGKATNEDLLKAHLLAESVAESSTGHAWSAAWAISWASWIDASYAANLSASLLNHSVSTEIEEWQVEQIKKIMEET